MSEKLLVSQLEGKKLAGRYEVEARIGSGGMAWLYRARDLESGQLVAVKILYEHMANQEKVRQRFEREAEIQSKIDHPHVVRVLRMLEEDCLIGLVMEWMAGGDLQAYLEKRPGPLPAEQIHTIFREILLGVQAAHRYDIVHRDLKPPNILLDRPVWPCKARVTDFGIAKVLEASSMTHTGSTMGTPLYIAPEQMLDSKTADQRADIYSLGVLLYRMSSGQLPFSDVASLLFKLMHEPPPPLPHLSPPIHAVLMRCLEKNPDLRWPNCQALLDAFEDALAKAPLYNDLDTTDLFANANRTALGEPSLEPPVSSPYAGLDPLPTPTTPPTAVAPSRAEKEKISHAMTLDMPIPSPLSTPSLSPLSTPSFSPPSSPHPLAAYLSSSHRSAPPQSSPCTPSPSLDSSDPSASNRLSLPTSPSGDALLAPPSLTPSAISDSLHPSSSSSGALRPVSPRRSESARVQSSALSGTIQPLPPGSRKTSIFAVPFADDRERLQQQLPRKPRRALRALGAFLLLLVTITAGLWYNYREKLWHDPQGTLTTAYIALSERTASLFAKSTSKTEQPSLPAEDLPPARSKPPVDAEGWYRDLPSEPASAASAQTSLDLPHEPASW